MFLLTPSIDTYCNRTSQTMMYEHPLVQTLK